MIGVVFSAQEPVRAVKASTPISSSLPEIGIKVDKSFNLVGSFSYKIRDVAEGETYVFVDAQNQQVKRLFIARFEGFLPHIDDYYRYSFIDAMTFGVHEFRQNTYACSIREAESESLNNKSVLTKSFLQSKGFVTQDERMMSRFVTVTGKDKKHLSILYYLENVTDTIRSLGDFYENDNPTPIWIENSVNQPGRSLESFEVM